MSAVTAPSGSSAGARSGARREIGGDDERRAGERGAGDERAMAADAGAAHEVRHDESDEADEPGGRDGGRREQRAHEIDAPAGAVHVHAESGGGLLAEREDVDVARLPEERRAGERDVEREPAPRAASRHRPPSPSSTRARRARCSAARRRAAP